MSHDLYPYLLISPADLANRPECAGMSSDELDELCRAATEEVEGICERQFVQRIYIGDSYKPTGTGRIRLRNPPVSLITEVRMKIAGTTTILPLTEVEIEDAETGSLYRAGAWGSRPSWDRSMVSGLDDPAPPNGWPAEWYGVGSARPVTYEFDYTGGYLHIPSIARRAALETALDMLSREDTLGMASETIGSYSYTRGARSDQNYNAGKIPSYEALLRLRISVGMR